MRSGQRPDPRGTSPTTGSNGGTGAGGSSGNGGGTIVPGQTPIEHVVFIVKENRTFNNYFATYPGAEGATEGGTIKCTEDGATTVRSSSSPRAPTSIHTI